jgi:DNA (cytosine-5)-methyltransferase 1
MLTLKPKKNNISSERLIPDVSSAAKKALQQKTVAEFFAGIGLMRLGLEKAGWSVAFANDIAVDKHAMYDAHFSDAQSHFVIGNIHEHLTRVAD